MSFIVRYCDNAIVVAVLNTWLFHDKPFTHIYMYLLRYLALHEALGQIDAVLEYTVEFHAGGTVQYTVCNLLAFLSRRPGANYCQFPNHQPSTCKSLPLTGSRLSIPVLNQMVCLYFDPGLTHSIQTVCKALQTCFYDIVYSTMYIYIYVYIYI